MPNICRHSLMSKNSIFGPLFRASEVLEVTTPSFLGQKLGKLIDCCLMKFWKHIFLPITYQKRWLSRANIEQISNLKC